LGFSLLAMDYGVFYGTYRTSGDGYAESGEFSPTAMALGIAFSQKISDHFSYGIHIKYVQQDLGEAVVATSGKSLDDPKLVLGRKSYSTGDLNLPVALDVGALYDFNYNGIKFGASLQNISQEFKYENEAFPMPFAVNFGATIEPLAFFDLQDKSGVLVLSAESRHPRDFGEKTKFGAEYTYIGMFTARFGYMSNYDERGFTMGLGIKHNLSGFPLRVDYAYEPFGVFGAVHFLSLGISY
ncbi:MAG: PorV/PorQ family protein, partial [Syntrophothermus sp.]